MNRKEVLEDYRKDWFLRNRGDNKPGKTAVRMLWNGGGNELTDCFRSVFSSHGFPVLGNNEQKREYTYTVALDFREFPLGEDQVRTVLSDRKSIYVTEREDFIPEAECPVLWVGRLYGAGLSFLTGRDAAENDSTNVIDCIGAVLFLLRMSGNEGRGVWYSGHGKGKKGRHLKELGYQPRIDYDDGAYMLSFSREWPEERFYFKNCLGGKLPDLQSVLLKMLIHFDKVCRENDIHYFLGGGTLLGAARHGGFIPWDDDMDVMMTRPEYEKLVKLAPELFTGEYYFQCNRRDSLYHSIFSKVRLKETAFQTRFSSRFPEMEQGMFIDVFVHDNTSGNRLLQRFHIFETLFARSLVFHKWEGTPMQFYGKMKLACAAATLCLRHIRIRKLEKFQEYVIRKYNKKNTGYYYDGTGEHLRHGAFPSEWLSKTSYLSFEGESFPVPGEYEKYLEYSYGNYRAWPAASLRKSGHDIVNVDFGSYINGELPS